MLFRSDLARKEVRELFGVTSPPSYERLIRWDRAMPQYLVGHMDRVAKIRARVSKLTGLAIVGNAFDGVGIPQCIRGARLAAKSLNFDPS